MKTFSIVIFFSLSAYLCHAQIYTDEVQVVEGLGGKVGIGTQVPEQKLDVRGNVVLETGSSPVIYTGTGAAELNRFLQLVNSPSSANASGLKAGGILVADVFDFANPGKNDLIVKGNVGIGTPTPGAKLSITGGSILLDASQYIYGYQTSGNRGFLKLYDGSTGNVEMGTTFSTGSISFQTNGYERMKVKSDGTVQAPQFSLQDHYHGQRVFVFSDNTTHPIDLVASFPSVGLVSGNVWAVFVKYCGFGTGGTVESREFTISRDSAGNWNSAAFSGNSTDTANLASVSGSGNSIIINTTSGTYVTAEVTVMIR